MPKSLLRPLTCFTFLALALFARAEITLYAFQPAAPSAVEALNARPEREKYVLSDKRLPGKYLVPRVRRPLDVARFPKTEFISRTSLAIVVDKTGAVVDAAPFNFNDTEFADYMVKAIPAMIAFVPNKSKKHERALFILTFNTRSEDPEEFVVGPAR